MKKQPILWMLLLAMMILGAGILAQYVLFDEEAVGVAADSSRSSQGVVFSEVMSKNQNAFCDSQGDYYDWFEITNRGSDLIDLYGWSVQKGDDADKVFVFPAQTIRPGECILVYASGRSSAIKGYAYQAGYKISASGDTLTLFDFHGQVQDQVEVPPLATNQAYRRDAQTGEWQRSMAISPALPNTEDNEALFGRQVVQDALEITEVMPANVTYLDGESDYIEIHNRSDRAVELSAYCLSDDPDKLTKWRFPQYTLGANEYLIVYANGDDRKSAPLATSFSLSKDGESVLLSKNGDEVVDQVSWDQLMPDTAVSKAYGEWTTLAAPTPGLPNEHGSVCQLDTQFRQAHSRTGLYINEVMSSTTQVVKGSDSWDWVELYNSTSQTIDLSGMGLSNKAGSPRRWQFPAGASIKGGQYLIVYLSGRSIEGADRNGFYHTNFRLSGRGGDVLTLCEADGTLIDRVNLPQQYGNVSYGRVNGREGFWYMDMPTPREGNTLSVYSARTPKVRFSQSGGVYDRGQSLTLELSAQEGAIIFYTLDCSDPTTSSSMYTGPITINDTTVVRAMAYKSGELESYVNTQTYLFGISHTVRVVSVVSDPDNLYSHDTGILYGSGQYGNYWKKEWEREAHVEIYLTDGSQQLSQGCGFKVHGAKSRELDQKSFKVIARSIYDETNRFEAALFEDLDDTEYQSIILRAGGQDGVRARMRDSLTAWLAGDIGLLHQDSELCVVYLNGKYYGQYEIRERINVSYLERHLGLEDSSGISLVKDGSTLAGSNQTYLDLLKWMKDNPNATDENLAYINTQIDLDNYIDFSALMVYTGNQDIGIRRYRDANADGRWRWIVFDFDFAFFNDVNSMERWMSPKGAGWYEKADNKLFAYCIRNDAFRDRYLTRLGELMSTCWTTDRVLDWIDTRREALLPEMPQMFERWDFNTVAKWENYVASLREFVATRKDKLLDYIQEACDLSDAEMEKYFGNAA